LSFGGVTPLVTRKKRITNSGDGEIQGEFETQRHRDTEREGKQGGRGAKREGEQSGKGRRERAEAGRLSGEGAL